MAGKHCGFIVVACVLVSSGCDDSVQPAAQGASGQSAVGAAAAPAAGGAGAAGSVPAPSGGGSGAPAPVGPGMAGAGPTEPAGAGTGGDAAPTAGTTAPEPPPPGGYDYEMEQVNLTADLVVASGATLHIGPGTTFTASSGVKVQVDGTLIAVGTADAPVRFVGAGTPRSWHGIVVASGGDLQLTHVEIGGATYGIHALAGSAFTVDRADIGTSFKAAVVASDGSFDHTRFHASGDPTFSAVNEVSIDDVNGTLTILDASPTVSNSSFDGSSALVDMIRVGGNSTPVFDHLSIKDAHCGIHANGGMNNAPIVTNTIFENLSYGLMVYATKPAISNSVFLTNGADIGFCFEATEANAPTLSGNYYSSGEAVIDPSCFAIGAAEASPAAMPNPAAGPVGL